VKRTTQLRRRAALRANPATTKAWQARSARRRDPVPSAVRQAVTARSGGRCEFPSCPSAFDHLHHRRRKSQGGKHDEETLMALCFRHHQLIHDNPAWAMAHGWLIGGEA
jgi:hypothetical protein